jgi:hypothetical protein
MALIPEIVAVNEAAPEILVSVGVVIVAAEALLLKFQ